MPRSTVTLRVFGDDLEPNEVSTLLGCEPSGSYRKGDPISPGRSEAQRRYGMWRLKSDDAEPEAYDVQIQSLLAKVTADLQVWLALGKRYQVDLFCGYFMDDSNQGFTLSLATLSALAARGIEPGFDLYAPESEGACSGSEQ